MTVKRLLKYNFQLSFKLNLLNREGCTVKIKLFKIITSSRVFYSWIAKITKKWAGNNFTTQEKLRIIRPRHTVQFFLQLATQFYS